MNAKSGLWRRIHVMNDRTTAARRLAHIVQTPGSDPIFGWGLTPVYGSYTSVLLSVLCVLTCVVKWGLTPVLDGV
jgi:hypothetical protein